MNYIDVKYITNPLVGGYCGISVKKNGVDLIIPLDTDNTDYANIMALVEAGELTIAPAEEPSE